MYPVLVSATVVWRAAASRLATCMVIANSPIVMPTLTLERFPHLLVPFGGPDHGIVDSRCFVEGARHVERKAMLVDGEGTKLRVHRLAGRRKRIFEGSSLCHRHLGHAVERRDEITGHRQRLQHGLPVAERIATSRRYCLGIEITDRVERLGP